MTTRRTFLSWLTGAAVAAVLPVATLLRCEPEAYEWLNYRTFVVAQIARRIHVPAELVEGSSPICDAKRARLLSCDWWEDNGNSVKYAPLEVL
jgi:hypothetical protein